MPGKVIMTAGAVAATEHPLASIAACRTMERGGNLFDAASAASLALTVTQPHMSGLGGDFFALFQSAEEGKVMCLNSSGWSPSSATIETGSPGRRGIPTFGPGSVVVPGYLKGIHELQRRFGALEFSRTAEDAILLAEEGFPVGASLVRSLRAARDELPQEALRTFGVDEDSPAVGGILRQPRLASTLREIAREGPEAFYEGAPARAIREALSAGGVDMTEEDLSSFEPEWCEPLRMPYKGVDVYEVPPNSMGATSLLLLKLLEEARVGEQGPASSGRIRATVEAAKIAYSIRDRELGDPRFVPFGLEHFLASRPSVGNQRRIDEADTTYFAAADREGNVLSCIQSIFHHFGSRVFVGDCGFFLNNRGSAFALEGPNSLEPRKRPLHTLSSLLLFRDGRPEVATGCSGGEYRPQQHALLVTNLVDYSMSLEEAIDFPRFLWDGGDEVKVEEGFSDLGDLGMKHRILGYPGPTGVAQGVQLMDGCVKGVCDVRGEGLPSCLLKKT